VANGVGGGNVERGIDEGTDSPSVPPSNSTDQSFLFVQLVHVMQFVRLSLIFRSC
jgi:hypothetical protein